MRQARVGHHLFLVVIALVLSGCGATSSLAKRSYLPIQPQPEVVYIPALNVEAQSEIGESMVSKASVAVLPAITLPSAVVHSGANFAGTMYEAKFQMTIPKGTLMASASDGQGVYYESAQKIAWVSGGTQMVTGGIYVPKAPGGVTEVYWLGASTTGGFVPLNDPHPNIPYEVTTAERWSKDSFKRELVYGGVIGSTISILYREFMDDMARPAFSQELKYDLSKGDVIGYRGARFQVLSTTNTAIKFKVQKALE